MSTAPAPQPLPERIVLYDGVCGLCNKTVQYLLRHDVEGALHYAPLQGQTVVTLRARYPNLPANLDSVVFIDENGTHLRSRAVVYAAKHLDFPARLLYLFRVVPTPLADLVYNFVAKNRYRIWGKYDTCAMPPALHTDHFLP